MNRWVELEKAEQALAEIEAWLKKPQPKNGYFALKWRDINNTRSLHLDDDIEADWSYQKTKLAFRFCNILRKQIAQHKKKLGFIKDKKNDKKTTDAA